MHAASATRAPLLLLGYGNPARGDDGLGCAAAEAIERLQLPGVRTSAKLQLTIDDAADAAEARGVIFVDAARAGRAPFAVAVVGASARQSAFASHHVRPELIVELCRRVFGREPAAQLVAIRGYAFDFEDGLSARAAANLARAVAHLRDVLLAR